MKRLLLDVDGVIADFLKATEWGMLKFYGLKPAREWTEWDIVKMDWVHYRNVSLRGTRDDHTEMLKTLWNRGCFCSSIPAYDGAIEQVNQLAQVFDVYFVTSPMATSQCWVYERSQWLIRHFGPDLGKKVVHTHYKELVVGAALIDDKPQHVIDWTREHGVSVISTCRNLVTFEGVLNRPYNQGIEGVRRYDSLLELLTYA